MIDSTDGAAHMVHVHAGPGHGLTWPLASREERGAAVRPRLHAVLSDVLRADAEAVEHVSSSCGEAVRLSGKLGDLPVML